MVYRAIESIERGVMSQVADSESEFFGFDDGEDAFDANNPAEADEKTATEPPDIGKQTIFSCEQCGLIFRKRDDFDRHRFAHTGVREYRCPETGCIKEYTNRSHLNRHIRANHREKPPQPGNVLRCKHSTCPKTFFHEQSMRRHYELKHVLGKSWSCQECGEKFWRKLQLKRHMFKHTGQYPHQCHVCEKGFINLRSLRNHRMTHALHRCDCCAAEFIRWKDLVAHRRLQHATLYQCVTCQRKFPSRKNLKAHVKVHRKSQENSDQEVFQCPHEGCPKFYDYERNLVAHIRSKHEGTRRYVCPVPNCGRSLSSNQTLEHHKRLHESAARSVPRMKAPNKPGAKRKDTGVPKRSTASRLANVHLEPQAEKVLIEQSPDQRPQLELEYSFSMESASESEVEASGKVVTVLEGQLAKIQQQIKLLQEQSSKG
ncbi:transcription factor IIIA [Toxorhynchites rutilus septentrionalis]|uniref:transcription factor IIIA n=1 Tax=Toxorhynchites rutilus septentrionalis TaxID=329112 RepID=UPI00247A4061|nr:transcription factor IIIA [Toxorhynchites rutilus septentrionalis]